MHIDHTPVELNLMLGVRSKQFIQIIGNVIGHDLQQLHRCFIALNQLGLAQNSGVHQLLYLEHLPT
jgi:hypothetical protein